MDWPPPAVNVYPLLHLISIKGQEREREREHASDASNSCYYPQNDFQYMHHNALHTGTQLGQNSFSGSQVMAVMKIFYARMHNRMDNPKI